MGIVTYLTKIYCWSPLISQLEIAQRRCALWVVFVRLDKFYLYAVASDYLRDVAGSSLQKNTVNKFPETN